MSVQQVQAGVTALLQKAAKNKRFYRVMRNADPVGVLIPNEVWDDLLEELEVAGSESYKRPIKQARAGKKWYSSDEVKKELGLG